MFKSKQKQTLRVGITGVPVGKSTFIESLVTRQIMVENSCIIDQAKKYQTEVFWEINKNVQVSKTR